MYNMILQSDISETLPMTAWQMQLILDSQERYRKRLLSELIALRIKWIEKYKWYDYKIDNLPEFERKYYKIYVWTEWTYLSIPELETLLKREKAEHEWREKAEIEKPVRDEIKKFNYIFIYCIYYLIILRIDEEYLSSQYITLYAIEWTKEIKQKQKEIERMKKEHFKKYWNWWEKIIYHL